MTRDQVLAHIAFLAQHEPDYAARALKWYHASLPWLGLIAAVVPAAIHLPL